MTARPWRWHGLRGASAEEQLPRQGPRNRIAGLRRIASMNSERFLRRSSVLTSMSMSGGVVLPCSMTRRKNAEFPALARHIYRLPKNISRQPLVLYSIKGSGDVCFAGAPGLEILGFYTSPLRELEISLAAAPFRVRRERSLGVDGSAKGPFCPGYPLLIIFGRSADELEPLSVECGSQRQLSSGAAAQEQRSRGVRGAAEPVTARRRGPCGLSRRNTTARPC